MLTYLLTMFNVLMSGQLYCKAETIEEAVRVVQMLERGMDRYQYHSPFTIVNAAEEPSLEVKNPNVEIECLTPA
jgi:hypothetical protein